MKKREVHKRTSPSIPISTEVAMAVLFNGKNSMAKTYPTKALAGIATPIMKIRMYVKSSDLEKISPKVIY